MIFIVGPSNTSTPNALLSLPSAIPNSLISSTFHVAPIDIPTGKAVAGSLLLLRTPLGPSHNSNCERPNRSMF